MIEPLYRRWIERWENHLCFRSTDRVVRPFEWGFDWSARWPIQLDRNGHSEENWALAWNEAIIKTSDQFFAHRRPTDFELKDGLLRFTSTVETPFPENNKVHAQWYPVTPKPGKRGDRAVVVLPHWNASLNQHGGLCRGIQKFGIPNLRLSLPYHDYRMPAELGRADYAVSSNILRTIDATRQAVTDIRSAVDWLSEQGYTRIGLVGTSLGSCYAFLASAHDPRIQVNVFNHCSSYFGDVVWTGLSTLHIKESVAAHLDLGRLRDVWQAISPVNFMEKFAAHGHKRSKFIYARYDTTFLPSLSRQILDRVRQHRINHEVAVLPCGHYTVGETPFKFLDGYHIIAPLVSWL
jgi:dienelactone hydrolase